MQPLTTDASAALLRALRMTFVNFDDLVLEEIRSRTWASVTFSGARHEIAFRLSGESAEAEADLFLEGLDATELRLRGHILADIAPVSREAVENGVRIRIEALTVEDA